MRWDMFDRRKVAACPSALSGAGRVAARATIRSACDTSRRIFGTSRGFTRSGILAKVKIALRTPSAKSRSSSSSPVSSVSRTMAELELRMAPTRVAGAAGKARDGRPSISRAMEVPMRETMSGAIPSVSETP